MKHFIVLLLLISVFIGCAIRSNDMNENGKIMIAQRGGSEYLSEHSLAFKVMAFAMDVDYIDQDVVFADQQDIVVNYINSK